MSSQGCLYNPVRSFENGQSRPRIQQRRCGTYSLLVEVMRNETDGTTQDEEAVQDTHSKVVFGFLGREGAAVSEQVDKGDSDTSCETNH
jgi:hypothetical protein